MCHRVWKEEEWPRYWNEAVIMPIREKGEGQRVEKYREVSITQSAYKVYATMLAERLREKVEEKGLLPSSQTKFKKGLRTIDNIYVLNYLINKYINGKKGKIVVLFVDLKAAFDSVDRMVFLEKMRKRDVREGLFKSCEEVLR